MRTIIVMLLLIGMNSCGRFGKARPKADHQERIVCISKTIQWNHLCLGGPRRPCGRGRFQYFPPEIKELPTIGYHRALSAEAILLAMKPSLILEDNNIGPEHVVAQLETIGNPNETVWTVRAYHRRNRFPDSRNGSLLPQRNPCRFVVCLSRQKHGKGPWKYRAIHHDSKGIDHPLWTSFQHLSGHDPKQQRRTDDSLGRRYPWPWRGTWDDATFPEIIAQSNPEVILLTDFGYDRLGSFGKHFLPTRVRVLPRLFRKDGVPGGRTRPSILAPELERQCAFIARIDSQAWNSVLKVLLSCFQPL